MGLAERRAKLRPGLAIGRHVNNEDFWGISFGRPTAYLLLLLVADWRWMTPNRITHISNLLLVTGSLLILLQSAPVFVLATVLINLSLTFDCADGQLARYRGAGSELGAYYDKISDYLGLILLFSILGWVTYEQTGEPRYILFAMLGLGCNMMVGYAKWVHLAAEYKSLGAPAPAPAAPGPRTWPGIAGYVFAAIFKFGEPDMFFWIGLGLVFDKLEWVMWFIVITQVPVGIGATIRRAILVSRMERTGR